MTLFPLSFPSVRGGDRQAYMRISIRAEDLFCPRPEIQLERREGELYSDGKIRRHWIEEEAFEGRPEDLTS